MDIEPVKMDCLTTAEMTRAIKEAVQSQGSDIENPALQRCADKPLDHEVEARQAYDRMYHTHNRG